MSTPFDELSRRAAAGTLTEAERAQFDALLREAPDRQHDADWDQAFAARLHDKVEAMPPMPGWARTLAELERPARARRPAGWRDRLAAWWQAGAGWSPPLQLAAAVAILLQALAIGTLLWQREPVAPLVRDLGGGQVPSGPLLRVSFKPEMTEARMREALVAVGGEIVGGPGQLGIYLVRVPEREVDQAIGRLRDSGVTDLVERARDR